MFFSNVLQSRMCSILNKHGLVHEKNFFIFFILICFINNVSTIQTTLNLQDKDLSSLFSNISDQSNSSPFTLESSSSSTIANQTSNDLTTIEQAENLLKKINEHFNSIKNFDQQSELLTNQYQNNFWPILKKPHVERNVRFSELNTLLSSPSPIVLENNLKSSYNTDTISIPTHSSSSSSSISSMSSLHSPRPSFLEQPYTISTNNPNFKSNYNVDYNSNMKLENSKNDFKKKNFIENQKFNPMNFNTNSFQTQLTANNNNYLNSANNFEKVFPPKLNLNHFKTQPMLNALTINNLQPSTTKLRVNTNTDMSNYKKKHLFNSRKNTNSLFKDNTGLNSFIIANKPINNWKQISSNFNSKFNTNPNFNFQNEDSFKNEILSKKFIPNRMQTEDYDDSNEDENIKTNNNANINTNSNTNSNTNTNTNNNQSPNQNDSSGDDDFSDTFNNNNENEINTETKKKKQPQNNDPMNLLLLNKLNQLNPNLLSKQKQFSNINFQGGGFNTNNPNQPYYVILPQMPTNAFEDLYEPTLETSLPIQQQHQKRRKSSPKSAKMSWWQRLLPERLRPTTPTAETNSNEGGSSEENDNKNKDSKTKDYLRGPSSESEIFTEVYGTGLQPNIPLPVYSPITPVLFPNSYTPPGYHQSNPPGINFLNPVSSQSSPLGLSSYYGPNGEEQSEEEAPVEEEAEDTNNNNTQSSTFADRMKNWWKNIFKNNSNSSGQETRNTKKITRKISPKIITIQSTY